MPLPETIRVKLSSESAEAISISPVVVQDLPARELIEHALAAAGKDEPRILEILRRGALVSGASRFRWAPLQVEPESLRALLATFPDPDPGRPFSPGACFRCVLRGGRQAIVIPRQAGERTGLLRRASFWGVLMEIAPPGLRYSGYSYRERADHYSRDLDAAEIARLREAAPLLRYSILQDQVRTAGFQAIEAFAAR